MASPPHPRIEEKEDYWTKALEPLGLTADDIGFDLRELEALGGDTCGLPQLPLWLEKPLQLPRYAEFYQNWYPQQLEKETPGHDVLMFLSGSAGGRVRRGYYYEPLAPFRRQAKEPEALVAAMESLYRATGKRFGGLTRTRVKRCQAMLPPLLREAVALLVFASAESFQWHTLAFTSFPLKQRRALAPRLWELANAETLGPPDRELLSLYQDVDFAYLYSGALDISEAMDDACRLVQSVTDPSPLTLDIHIPTPLGRLVISPQGGQLYEDEDYFLVLDLQGNDTYRTAGSVSHPDKPISLVIDVQGDDRYEAVDDKAPSAGAAVFGYAMVYDLAGNDTYQGGFMAQGCGTFGVGMLFDCAGDDIYSVTQCGQGAGNGGIGVLIDRAGRDRYELLQSGQGFGFTRGCGLLLDTGGDDYYLADDTRILFPSSQTQEHNTSAAQGYGTGFRDDLVTGHSLGGGLGMLIDTAGDDRYEAGVFSQGAGYWYGAGILADRSGNDTYRGVWYTQGSAAHFGIGVLWEGGGSDSYQASMHMSQGAGHDYSVGLLFDEAGHDVYQSASHSLGMANANGIGLFLDRMGNDVYQGGNGFNFGGAQLGMEDRTLRDVGFSLGVFLDLGGNDTYNKPYCGNNKHWLLPDWKDPNLLFPAEQGVGMDAEWPVLQE